LSKKNWERIKKEQGLKTVSAQMLLNPLAGNEATFLATWLTTYEVLPSMMNVYVLVDPSKGKGTRSDRTAIAVIGVDPGGSKYLIDGYCHRMSLSERWSAIKNLKRKWETYPGVQMVKIGYEQYGLVDDINTMKGMMQAENHHFQIHELSTPESGGHSKRDRIERLEPDIRNGRFLLPCVAHHQEFGGLCYWSVWTEEHEKGVANMPTEERETAKNYRVGQVIYRRHRALTRPQIQMDRTSQKYRIATALRRRNEQNDIYDVTRIFIEEVIRHPFAAHDDLLDASARIYDIGPMNPVKYERQSTEPIGLEGDELGPHL